MKLRHFDPGTSEPFRLESFTINIYSKHGIPRHYQEALLQGVL
jgi:hypothetical protein